MQKRSWSKAFSVMNPTLRAIRPRRFAAGWRPTVLAASACTLALASAARGEIYREAVSLVPQGVQAWELQTWDLDQHRGLCVL